MKLHRKTMLIIGATILGLILLLYTASQFILIGSFYRLEEQDTQRNIERARDALIDETNRLDSIAGDYSAWDDAYTYVQDGNEEFIEANIMPSSLANLRINYMLFYNSSGYLLHGGRIDNENNENIDIPVIYPLIFTDLMIGRCLQIFKQRFHPFQKIIRFSSRSFLINQLLDIPY